MRLDRVWIHTGSLAYLGSAPIEFWGMSTKREVKHL